jgi:hypothetical protein
MNPENSKRKKTDIWDISIYTDEEIIHNLLNMSNPTDRELEIKIWSHIQQYKSAQQTPDNLRWLNFYEQIYHRLFSFSEDEREEKFKTHENKEGQEDQESDDEPFESNETNEEKVEIEGFDTTNQPQTTLVTTTPKTQSKNDKNDKPTGEDTGSTKLVTQLQYATGNVNPLLKEVLTRTLTIDSQYRDNKKEPTTNFILNLTETIKNVVNISLYSIHIPFTWYTISTNFGSNYFYINGSSPGVNGHQYKVEIPSGNYSQTTLATAINVSLQSIITNNTDICFGRTNIYYNPNNMLMTLTIDIQNVYNQNYYYLSFPKNPFYDYSGNIDINDPNYIKMRKSTIPSFLGITDISYNLNMFQSLKTIPNTNNTTSNYIMSDITDISNNLYPNNQIWIYQYQGTTLFDPSNSTILATYSITITPPGGYSRTSLISTIQNAIQSSTFLNPQTSYFKKIPIQDSSFAYIEFSFQLNRAITINQQYVKTVVFLPDDSSPNNYNIWTGPCFDFYPQYPSIFINPNHSTTPIGPYFPFYQNELFSEYPTIQSSYDIYTDANMIFKVITPYYDISINNYILTVPQSLLIGYILPDYITAIKNAFINIKNISSGLDISGNQIFNSKTTPFFINDTNSIPYFDLDMNISFNQDTYTIDLTDSPLYTVLNIGNSYGYSSSVINLMDLSSNNYRIDFSFVQQPSYDMTCINNTLLKVYPIPNGNYGNQNAPEFAVPPVYTPLYTNNSTLYNNLSYLQSDIQTAFRNYIDVILNSNPLQNVKISINTSPQGIYPDNYYIGSITFLIENTLTETNYSLSFYDISGSWSKYLHFKDNSGATLSTDISYILSRYHSVGQSYSEISGSNVVLNQSITITTENNTFSINTLPNSDFQSTENNFIYTVPVGNYTRDQLIAKINSIFKTYNATYNTSIGLKTINGNQYSYFFIDINKVFTASDYSIVFYDSSNFQQCSVGNKSTGNAAWDSTLGWILGFRENTSYDLINYIDISANPPFQLNDICKLQADTTCSTTLFNYFILSIDDFNQNHTNDGLVTITTIEKSIPLPSYANRSKFVCDPSSGLYLYTGITDTGSNNLTQNQIYSITEIMNNNVNSGSLNGNVPISKYSFGPFISDVLAIIPVKTGGVVNGQTIIVDGGTLQTQNRKYFGPINLNRLLITLYDDRGHVVNLNNSNWSFTLLVDQIYKKSAASS